MSEPEKHIKPRNYSHDLYWNAVSFAIMAAVGVLINILLLQQYDAAVLGVFNQVYALYLIFSQLTTGGYHLSVQSYVAKHVKRQNHYSSVLESALFLAVFQSVVVILLAYPLLPLIARFLDSQEVADAFYYLIPALLFFTINKLLLAYLNARRQMKAFAIFRAARFLIVIAVLIIMFIYKLDAVYFPLCYGLAEPILFLPLLAFVFQSYRMQFTRLSRKWITIQWRFGSRAFIGNFIMDINSKVDVLMLGAFLGNAQVGLYSFASTLTEGLRAVNEVFRNNFNPILSKAYFEHPKSVLQRIIKNGVRSFYKYLGGLTLLASLGFPLVLWVFQIDKNVFEIGAVFYILVAGILLACGYLPVRMIFNQAGFASHQTRLFLFHFLVNVVLNLIFIPIFGIYGAALATSLALLAQLFILKGMMKRKIGIEI